MNYGMYLSAAGVMANSYRQDVIANNLANSETTGFRRDVPIFHERLTSAMEMRSRNGWGEQLMDNLSGGLLAMPTGVDFTPGDLEPTGNPLDVALTGEGFFQVQDSDGKKLLTRDGRFMVDRGGRLTTSSGFLLLDPEGQPITLDPSKLNLIDSDGAITSENQSVGQLSMVKTDRSNLTKHASGLFEFADAKQLRPLERGSLQPRMVERGNVDPAVELTKLMDAQRQLEANANMIKFQDQMLSKLVNEVGKIS